MHAGSHSVTKRTNVSAIFSDVSGKSWRGEVMIWQDPLIGGYVAVQAWKSSRGGDGNAQGVKEVGVVFENATCSVAIGVFGLE